MNCGCAIYSVFKCACISHRTIPIISKPFKQYNRALTNIALFCRLELESSNGSEIEEAGTGNGLEDPRPKTTRSWTPLSLYNTDYVALLKEREVQLVKHDFVKENIVSKTNI